MANDRQHQCLLLGIDAAQHKAVTVDGHSQRAVGTLMLVYGAHTTCFPNSCILKRRSRHLTCNTTPRMKMPETVDCDCMHVGLADLLWTTPRSWRVVKQFVLPAGIGQTVAVALTVGRRRRMMTMQPVGKALSPPACLAALGSPVCLFAMTL